MSCLLKLAFLNQIRVLKPRVLPNTQFRAKFASSSGEKPEIPKNLLADQFTATQQKENGYIYDKRPFKVTLEAGKTYAWCLCGRSRTQPFCDKTHKSIFLKIKMRPILFQVEKTKDYWVCNCKQTKNRPFCDGTHKQPDIQAADVKVNY